MSDREDTPFGLPAMSDSYPLDEHERREIADLRAAHARERGRLPLPEMTSRESALYNGWTATLHELAALEHEHDRLERSMGRTQLAVIALALAVLLLAVTVTLWP